MIGNIITKDRWEYERLLASDQPRCGDNGPSKATCILLPGHAGDWHEGNGFDTFGPKYQAWRTS